ncbi:G-PROTEIN-RECEP-F1-2 domain-containing protein [Aphelenchoides besseyi]|nr:G-PROTEIN-RECEP-F1-2 domain-containing protein [Aphelenchoides besseyi]KAI6194417.1 G-PROTEIN-RECEP-F1-2 domain-containing protein [Aphelenchoides besseyi]
MSDFTVIYIIAELTLALIIVGSNSLVLWVFLSRKQVRTPTNTYIFSLALTDFLAGLIGIPLTAISVLTRWPHSFDSCLYVHLILCVLCTVSTFHLLAIAIDKFVTICCRCQLLLDQRARHNRARTLIVIAWIVGGTVGLLPIFDVFGFATSNRSRFRGECHFTMVVDYRYLVYVIFFSTILLPSILVIFFYISIYRRIRLEEKQISCLLRASERRRRMRNRRKLIKTLILLVCAYTCCWFPLYLLNTFDYFLPNYRNSSVLTLITVVISHCNCVINPLIYAYGLPGFKQSLRQFFGIRTATIKNPYGGTVQVPCASQKVPREVSTSVLHYTVDGNRKSSRSLAHLGQSIDSENYLGPLFDSTRHKLQPIHESRISLFN